MWAHPKQPVYSCTRAAPLPPPCTKAQLQRARDNTISPSLQYPSFARVKFTVFEVVRNVFKTFYLQTELLIHHGPLRQTQCRLGLGYHINTTPPPLAAQSRKQEGQVPERFPWPAAVNLPQIFCISAPIQTRFHQAFSHGATLQLPVHSWSEFVVSLNEGKGE